MANLLYTRVKYANPNKPIGKREMNKRAKAARIIKVVKYGAYGAKTVSNRVESDRETINKHL